MGMSDVYGRRLSGRRISRRLPGYYILYGSEVEIRGDLALIALDNVIIDRIFCCTKPPCGGGFVQFYRALCLLIAAIGADSPGSPPDQTSGPAPHTDALFSSPVATAVAGAAGHYHDDDLGERLLPATFQTGRVLFPAMSYARRRSEGKLMRYFDRADISRSFRSLIPFVSLPFCPACTLSRGDFSSSRR